MQRGGSGPTVYCVCIITNHVLCLLNSIQGLISDASRCLVCNAADEQSASKRLSELHQQLSRQHEASGSAPSIEPSTAAPSIADSARSRWAVHSSIDQHE